MIYNNIECFISTIPIKLMHNNKLRYRNKHAYNHSVSFSIVNVYICMDMTYTCFINFNEDIITIVEGSNYELLLVVSHHFLNPSVMPPF